MQRDRARELEGRREIDFCPRIPTRADLRFVGSKESSHTEVRGGTFSESIKLSQEQFMTTGPASAIQHQVDHLISLQIETFAKKSPLTSAQLFEYHARFKNIQALYGKLDRIKQVRSRANLASAS